MQAKIFQFLFPGWFLQPGKENKVFFQVLAIQTKFHALQSSSIGYWMQVDSFQKNEIMIFWDVKFEVQLN